MTQTPPFAYHTVAKTVLADMHTPVSVYMKLRDLYAMSALMESSDYHDAANARSFIGIHPIASVAVGHGKAVCRYPDGNETETEVGETNTVDRVLDTFLNSFHTEGPLSQYCGLYGYTTFNAVRYFEPIDIKDSTMDENDAPDILYVLFKDIIIFDHHNNLMHIVVMAQEEEEGTRELEHLQKMMARVHINP